MPSIGIDRFTGQVITGWDRTLQSLVVCLTTELGERVQRRDFGCGLFGLIDTPASPDRAVDFIMAVAEAIEPRRVGRVIYGEPCFGITSMTADLRTPGKAVLSVSGNYYPEGHSLDFSTFEAVDGTNIQLG